jgi:hypothetical protein
VRVTDRQPGIEAVHLPVGQVFAAAAALPRTVWAAGAGQSQVAFGLPTDDDAALEFRFHVGNPVYRKLVSTPGLRARIAIDRQSGQIISVTFTGRA